MDVAFSYNPGHALPKVISDTHSVSSAGGWGGTVGGATPVVNPMPTTYEGHFGEMVNWDPVIVRDVSFLHNLGVGILWGAGTFALTGLFTGPVGLVYSLGVTIATTTAAEANNPGYTERISGKWFVWQGCSHVHIINIGPGGVATGTGTTTLPTTTLLVQPP